MNDDSISRKAAIEAIGKESDELYENIKKGATFPQRQWFDGMAQAQSILENLPSAQPATSCSENPNASDVVSRKAVREMVATWSYDMAEWEDIELALHDVDELPPAQPEVIHCKDCDLWHRAGCPMNIFVEKPEPGYFCGTAKRKEK